MPELPDIVIYIEMIVTRPPTDHPWGVRECHIRHPDGHTFRVSAGIEEE